MKQILGSFLFFVLFSYSFALSLDPYSQGKMFQEREQWFNAIELYQQVIDENPAHSKAYQGLAECFYVLEEYKQALDMVEKAQVFRKNDAELLNLRGFIYIGLEQLEHAQKVFETVIQTWPNDIQARFGLAELEISSGRINAATDLYRQALQRNPDNRKALLSLAIIHFENNNFDQAQDYIQKALEFHGDNPQTFYFASYFEFLKGRYGEAEKKIRNALDLRPDYDEALHLLSTILFTTNRYLELIEVIDLRLLKNRNDANAWYLKTIALEKLGKPNEAIKTAKTGLDIATNDEIFRAYADQLVHKFLDLEDITRKHFASWHYKKANSYEKNNLIEQAISEYLKTLQLDPYHVDARLAYAQLLLQKGYMNRYLEQLLFIKSLGKETSAITDAIESYSKILENSLQSQWGIRSLFLDKVHTKIGLYCIANPKNLFHPEAEVIATEKLAQICSQNQLLSVYAYINPVPSYAQAFQTARANKDDYFALINFNENIENVEIIIDLYVTYTGSKIDSFSVFRIGNDRFFNTMLRVAQTLNHLVPHFGKIITRSQNKAIIDLGKTNGLEKDLEFDIISPDSYALDSDGLTIIYDIEEIIGTFKVQNIDDDIAEGSIERAGFYDRISEGNLVIPIVEKQDSTTNTEKTQSTQVLGQKQLKPLLDLIRIIR